MFLIPLKKGFKATHIYQRSYIVSNTIGLNIGQRGRPELHRQILALDLTTQGVAILSRYWQ
jgi:hypothetical protein